MPGHGNLIMFFFFLFFFFDKMTAQKKRNSLMTSLTDFQRRAIEVGCSGSGGPVPQK